MLRFFLTLTAYLFLNLDIRGTKISGRKRKSPMAAANDTQCLPTRVGINKNLNIRKKTNASSGPKRLPAPKLAAIVEAATPEGGIIKPTKRLRQQRGKKKMDTYTMDSVMEQYDAESEFGKALRDMPDAERIVAVAKLNKGANDGLKGAVKSKLLATKFSTICIDKLKATLIAARVAEDDMFRKPEPVNRSRTMHASAVSVGDWVEVDGDRSPGWNSEGGIAMVTACTLNTAEVKYILTRRVEKLVPMYRLTTIVMPHRSETAVLRIPTPKKKKESPALVGNSMTAVDKRNFKTMTTMQLLSHGLATTLHRKQGWLKELLFQEGGKLALHLNYNIAFDHATFFHQGILEDKPDALKLRVGYDYNNQLAFIEGMIPLSVFLTFRNASSYDSRPRFQSTLCLSNF